ncbi:MAG: hypothetical protein LBS07_05685, partial [Prevotellaceae bacterium]|nr:hypothetical protein [Prevotellaceae bacterium]
ICCSCGLHGCVPYAASCDGGFYRCVKLKSMASGVTDGVTDGVASFGGTDGGTACSFSNT